MFFGGGQGVGSSKLRSSCFVDIFLEHSLKGCIQQSGKRVDEIYLIDPGISFKKVYLNSLSNKKWLMESFHLHK